MNCSGPFAPTGPRECVVDPSTGRGFVFSSTGKGLNRPEFLFFYAPGDPNIISSVCEIISDYEETNTLPGNLEDVAVDPLEQGSQLRFKARILAEESNATLKTQLEANFLHHVKTRGIVVMVPTMEGEACWGRGDDAGACQQ